jgi:hypothetical protein
MIDDITFSRPEIYDWIVLILRQFKQLIAKTVRALESFEEGEARFFESEEPGNRKASLLGVIRKQVSDLKTLHETLLEKTEMFDNMQSRVRITHTRHRVL